MGCSHSREIPVETDCVPVLKQAMGTLKVKGTVKNPELFHDDISGHYKVGFCAITPIPSPLMKEGDDVVTWFNRLPTWERIKIRESGKLTIYFHIFAPHDMVICGREARKGEIIFTSEASWFDFSLGKWIKAGEEHPLLKAFSHN
jgi:hypothetical protein